MQIDFCWDDDTTGCICGNECEPPQWIINLWDDIEIRNHERLATESGRMEPARSGMEPPTIDRMGEKTK